MMSRNSCSKGLVQDCMKRNLWAIVLSTVGFFMAAAAGDYDGAAQPVGT